MQNLVRNLAGVFLVLFIGVWGFVIGQVWAASGSLQLPDGIVTVAGFLASSVGAATAAILGIEIQKIQQSGSQGGVGANVRAAAGADKMVTTGVYVYAAVGIAVLVTWLARESVSPELVKAFALGALGWFAGSFSAVFRAG